MKTCHLLAAFALLGLASHGGYGTASTTEKTIWDTWPDAVAIENDVVRLIVVPEIGRILYFGFHGEENLLWTDIEGNLAREEEGAWKNWGGDKLWPWPQDDWPRQVGSAWPPPSGFDQAPHSVHVSGNAVRMVSPVELHYGIRIHREIRLADGGAEVLILNRFERVSETENASVAVWSVTQMPAPDFMLARILPDTSLENGFRKMVDGPWKHIEWVGRDLLRIERQTEEAAKIGLDADVLAWVRGDRLFVQEVVDPAGSVAGYAPGDKAQIYSGAGEPTDSSTYIELEFTSPVRAPEHGDEITLVLRWKLFRLTDSPSGMEEALLP